jgi:hypothetical protein
VFLKAIPMMGDGYCSARVAVDIRPLLAARTGVGKYQASVMRAVMQMNSGVHYTGFGAYDWTPITTDQLDVSSQKEAGAGRAETLLRKVPFAPSAFHALRSAAYRLSLVRRHVDFFHAFLYRPPAFSERRHSPAYHFCLSCMIFPTNACRNITL